jgi:hypothetical protein
MSLSGELRFGASAVVSAGEEAARGWQFIRTYGVTGCARGGHFGFWARIASRDKLLIFFQGGGGCFTYGTCAVGSTWFDAAVTGADRPQRSHGIFDPSENRNPFRSWSMVYIPSCGGDVFIGSTDHTYRNGNKHVTIHHRGWYNAEVALAWAYQHVQRPRRVFLTGSSAGSVGSTFHASDVMEHYPDAKVVQFGDSEAFLSPKPMHLTEWHGLEHLPAWMRTERDVQPGAFTMVAFLTRLMEHYPGAAFARFNFRDDIVQKAFYAAEGGTGVGFRNALLQAERTLQRRNPRYRSFLACGHAHTILPLRQFYEINQQGIALRDWVDRLSAGLSIRSTMCTGR